jgi:hypothetical protein
MVENQHQKIIGYRDLSVEEIALMNLIKEHEKQIAAVHLMVQKLVPERSEAARQANIARTEFESAFMRLVRAVAQPASPWEHKE